MKKVLKNLKPVLKEDSMENTNSRRQFLKKSVYSAPVLMALGQLANPTKSRADSGPPNGPPGGWGGGF